MRQACHCFALLRICLSLVVVPRGRRSLDLLSRHLDGLVNRSGPDVQPSADVFAGVRSSAALKLPASVLEMDAHQRCSLKPYATRLKRAHHVTDVAKEPR